MSPGVQPRQDRCHRGLGPGGSRVGSIVADRIVGEAVELWRGVAVRAVHAQPILAERVRGSDRPSLTGRPIEEELGEVLARREAVYRRLAHLTIDTGAEDLVHVIDRILYRA